MNPPMMNPYPPNFSQPPFMNAPMMPAPTMPTAIAPIFGSDVMPKESLYINNLNDKIKPEELRTSIYFLFSQFGEIMKIVCSNTWNLRGQAFVVFQSTVAATQALKKINYTKERSEILAKLDGTWVSKDRPKITKRGVKMIKKKVKTEENSKDDNNNKIPRPNNKNLKEYEDEAAPNNVLYVQNIPSFATEPMIRELFKQYPGFKEVRLIPTKEIAFVEYDEEPQASIALAGLNGFRITKDREINVKYAKV